jgi:hypothetical protein
LLRFRQSFIEFEGKLRANVMFVQLSHQKIADSRAKQMATNPDVTRLTRKTAVLWQLLAWSVAEYWSSTVLAVRSGPIV